VRAEQLIDPAAYHGHGPAEWLRWGGLRWVDMLAGDVLASRPTPPSFGATSRPWPPPFDAATAAPW
jgi:hypothetical protein